jgi:PRTRC genetic system protein F
MRISSLDGEEVLLEVLEQRARLDLSLPELLPTKLASQWVDEMLGEMVTTDPAELEVMPCYVCLETPEVRNGEDDDPFDEDEITLCVSPGQTGVWSLGRTMAKLEAARRGAAETVLARLGEANTALGGPLALPACMLDLMIAYDWWELEFDGDSRMNLRKQLRPQVVDGQEDYSAADALISQFLIETRGEEEPNRLPSNLFPAWKGPLSHDAALSPQDRVKLTTRTFTKAGFPLKEARELARRLEVDIPALTAKVREVSQTYTVTSELNVHAAAVLLGDEEHATVDILDEYGNLRMQSGRGDHTFRVGVAPEARAKARGRSASRRGDGFIALAAYLNLLAHVDFVVAALSN